MLTNQTISAIDIGTSKICTIVAEVDENTHEPIIKGIGITPSHGIKKGTIVDIEKASAAVKQSVREAENSAEKEIGKCYVNITGTHIRSMNTNSAIVISRNSHPEIGEAREIDKEDIEKVLEQARSIPLPIDRQILHLIPQDYTVDEQEEINNPIGLLGHRLEARAHVTTYNTTVASNISHCLKNANVEVKKFVLQALASSYSTLEDDEKEMGSVLIDIGGGTTDVIVFHEGNVYHTGVIGLGGYNISNDIAYLLRVPLNNAENLKRNFGYAKPSSITKNEVLQIDRLANQKFYSEVTTDLLAEYIEPRVEEIIREAYLETKKSGLATSNIISVVLTGGSCLLKGIDEIAEEIFKTPARIACPKGYIGFEEELNNPSFSASIGLLKFAIEDIKKDSIFNKHFKNPISKKWSHFKKIIENIM